MGLDTCLVNIYPPLQYHTDVKLLCAPPIHPFRSHDYSLLKVDMNLKNFCQLYIPSTYKTFLAHSRCSVCTDKSSGSFNAPAVELELKKEKKMLKMNRIV